MSFPKRALFIILAAAVLVAGGASCLAEIVYRRSLTPVEEAAIADFSARLKKSSASEIEKASLLAKLAEMRHERGISAVVPFLSASREILQLTAAGALGDISSPRCAQYLISSYREPRETAAMRLACLEALGKIADFELQQSDNSTTRSECIVALTPMLDEGRIFFGSLANSEVAEGIECWPPILRLLGMTPEIEKRITDALGSPAIEPSQKTRLCRIYLTVTPLSRDDVARRLEDEYSRSVLLRYKTVILAALGAMKASRKFLLAQAMEKSGNPLLRRSALDALLEMLELLSVSDVLPLLATENDFPSDSLMHLARGVIRIDTIAEFCTKALAASNSVAAGRACAGIRDAVTGWRKNDRKTEWLAMFDTAVPFLMDLMAVDSPDRSELRRQAYLALLSLFPRGEEPPTQFEWTAAPDKRKSEIDEIRLWLAPENMARIREGISRN
ncbi:MAG: hypothetical protein WC712_04590 [Candidatus Brocadiia bacterium]